MCAYKVNAYSSIRKMLTEASTCNTQIMVVDIPLRDVLVLAYVFSLMCLRNDSCYVQLFNGLCKSCTSELNLHD